MSLKYNNNNNNNNMLPQRMKKLSCMVQSMVDTLMEYFDILENQRERTMRNHHESASNEDSTFCEEFTVTNVKMKVE